MDNEWNKLLGQYRLTIEGLLWAQDYFLFDRLDIDEQIMDDSSRFETRRDNSIHLLHGLHTQLEYLESLTKNLPNPHQKVLTERKNCDRIE